MNREKLPIAWVAYDGHTALGTAALRETDLKGREDLSPWLGGVFVSPPYRGRGIASALCRVVEANAYERGISRLYLFTHGQESLYEHLGWSSQEQMLWHGQRCSIMSKVPVPSGGPLERTRDK
jgi:GNAT superfamily N-acetyltransferase